MSDYISREALIDRLNNNLSACNHGTFSEMCYADAIETVKNLPAADVEPVRRGNWNIRVSDERTLCLECSVCGRKVIPERKRQEVGNTPIDGQISLEELK